MSPVNPGDSATRQQVCHEGPPHGHGGEDFTWPDQVAPRGRKASSTRNLKTQTSNLKRKIQVIECFLIFSEWGKTRIPFKKSNAQSPSCRGMMGTKKRLNQMNE